LDKRSLTPEEIAARLEEARINREKRKQEEKDNPKPKPEKSLDKKTGKRQGNGGETSFLHKSTDCGLWFLFWKSSLHYQIIVTIVNRNSNKLFLPLPIRLLPYSLYDI
jgi:hypothetical protein